MLQKLCFYSFSFKKELKQLLFFFSVILVSIICYIVVIYPIQPPNIFSIKFSSQILTSRTSLPSNVSSKTCDYSNGKWVWDDAQPKRRYTENCPFLDPGFRCQQNGRHDLKYQNWRWQPEGCDFPGYNAKDFLERSRNGRIVFVGDSVGRNQWESFVCLLTLGVSNQSTIYEEFGNPITKHKGFLSIKFGEFNLTVQYYRLPFIVSIDRPPQNASKEVHGVIRIDKLHWYSNNWVRADIIVFSAGHWWNQDKTVKSGRYFQEGTYINMTMDVMEGFRRALNTLKSWMMQNLEPKTSAVFFPSYSPAHFSDGAWNQGGYCNTSVEPETDYRKLEPEPIMNVFINELVKQMKSTVIRNVRFLNVTFMTSFRKEGHPSSNNEPGTPITAPQDCSHWCLPGVPDTWNDLLYAELLRIGFRTRQL